MQPLASMSTSWRTSTSSRDGASRTRTSSAQQQHSPWQHTAPSPSPTLHRDGVCDSGHRSSSSEDMHSASITLAATASATLPASTAVTVTATTGRLPVLTLRVPGFLYDETVMATPPTLLWRNNNNSNAAAIVAAGDAHAHSRATSSLVDVTPAQQHHQQQQQQQRRSCRGSGAAVVVCADASSLSCPRSRRSTSRSCACGSDCSSTDSEGDSSGSGADDEGDMDALVAACAPSSVSLSTLPVMLTAAPTTARALDVSDSAVVALASLLACVLHRLGEWAVAKQQQQQQQRRGRRHSSVTVSASMHGYHHHHDNDSGDGSKSNAVRSHGNNNNNKSSGSRCSKSDDKDADDNDDKNGSSGSSSSSGVDGSGDEASRAAVGDVVVLHSRGEAPLPASGNVDDEANCSGNSSSSRNSNNNHNSSSGSGDRECLLRWRYDEVWYTDDDDNNSDSATVVEGGRLYATVTRVRVAVVAEAPVFVSSMLYDIMQARFLFAGAAFGETARVLRVPLRTTATRTTATTTTTASAAEDEDTNVEPPTRLLLVREYVRLRQPTTRATPSAAATAAAAVVVVVQVFTLLHATAPVQPHRQQLLSPDTTAMLVRQHSLPGAVVRLIACGDGAKDGNNSSSSSGGVMTSHATSQQCNGGSVTTDECGGADAHRQQQQLLRLRTSPAVLQWLSEQQSHQDEAQLAARTDIVVAALRLYARRRSCVAQLHRVVCAVQRVQRFVRACLQRKRRAVTRMLHVWTRLEHAARARLQQQQQQHAGHHCQRDAESYLTTPVAAEGDGTHAALAEQLLQQHMVTSRSYKMQLIEAMWWQQREATRRWRCTTGDAVVHNAASHTLSSSSSSSSLLLPALHDSIARVLRTPLSLSTTAANTRRQQQEGDDDGVAAVRCAVTRTPSWYIAPEELLYESHRRLLASLATSVLLTERDDVATACARQMSATAVKDAANVHSTTR